MSSQMIKSCWFCSSDAHEEFIKPCKCPESLHKSCFSPFIEKQIHVNHKKPIMVKLDHFSILCEHCKSQIEFRKRVFCRCKTFSRFKESFNNNWDAFACYFLSLLYCILYAAFLYSIGFDDAKLEFLSMLFILLMAILINFSFVEDCLLEKQYEHLSSTEIFIGYSNPFLDSNSLVEETEQKLKCRICQREDNKSYSYPCNCREPAHYQCLQKHIFKQIRYFYENVKIISEEDGIKSCSIQCQKCLCAILFDVSQTKQWISLKEFKGRQFAKVFQNIVLVAMEVVGLLFIAQTQYPVMKLLFMHNFQKSVNEIILRVLYVGIILVMVRLLYSEIKEIFQVYFMKLDTVVTIKEKEEAD